MHAILFISHVNSIHLPVCWSNFEMLNLRILFIYENVAMFVLVVLKNSLESVTLSTAGLKMKIYDHEEI